MTEPFTTPETSLAAFLIQSGFPLQDISYELKPSGKRQGIFVFADSLELKAQVTLFETGQATANIVLFEHTKSSLIDRVMGRDR